MDVKKLFIELTEYIVPYKKENIFEPYLPENIEIDAIGNYYIIIGESKSMFTCHLDNVCYEVKKVKHVFYEDEDGSKVKTDGRTILGSDDKSGMVIMLNMIEHNVPGCYYFFIGEERGAIGSNGIHNLKRDWFRQFDRCISFDRKGYGSIISRQRGQICCSQDFVNALAIEFNINNMTFKDDPTGVYTDSATFMPTIREVSNLSCGGFGEHTIQEWQNLTYLEKMCNATVKINWENLPTVREIVVSKPYVKPEPYVKPHEYKKVSDYTRSKTKTINQKKKPDLGIFNYKKYVGKSKKEVVETICDYMDYYGFNNEKVNRRSGDSVVETTIYLTKVDNKAPKGAFRGGFYVHITGDGKILCDRIKFNNLEEFEKFYDIDFPAKFYRYVDDFVNDINEYFKKYGRNKFLYSGEINKMLKKYGTFTFNELVENYDLLFDKDDFVISKNGQSIFLSR